jgi:hypothetical protein
MFLTIYKIAMDYLPIQVSAIPCEHMFSSSSEPYMKKHNQVSSHLMEALQMLKFALKKEHLHAMKGWVALQKDMEYYLLYALDLPSSDKTLPPCSSSLFLSATSGTTSSSGNHDALLRIIAEKECDNIPDDVKAI